MFISILLLGSVMLLTKALTYVLFSHIDKTLLYAYVGADLGLFLMIKVARDDFYYWIAIDGYGAVILGLLSRIVVKVVADFTGIGKRRNLVYNDIKCSNQCNLS